MADYLVQEDGSSKILLEDASGALLLEAQPTVTVPFIGSATAVFTPVLYYTGQQTVVTTPGTFQWLCPAGITLVYVECIAGGGGGDGGQTNQGYAAGGGGAYAGRVAVPVTPGTLYTFVVGSGGAGGTQNVPVGGNGGDSTFTGDSSVQVVAKGGHGGNSLTAGQGGQAASSTGDVGHVFSGGDGGAGASGPANDGAGGGASGNRLATGANGTNGGTGGPLAGGAGANGGGSGGAGGTNNSNNAQPGSSPGGGGGGAANLPLPTQGGGAGANGSVTITAFALPFITSVTVAYPPTLVAQLALPFIGSVSSVYTPTFVPQLALPFVNSVTAVYTPSLVGQLPVAFISSVTVVYTPTLVSATVDLDLPFIASVTRVYGIFSLFDPNKTFGGPGNGGETYKIRLAPNGTNVTATLATDITAAARALQLTSDSGLPSDAPFMVTIDAEVIYISRTGDGSYQIRLRGLSNTTPASHTSGTSVIWTDSYDQAIVAGAGIAHNFTADIASSGSFTYDGWLICFDSSQAYQGTDRYPFHVTEVLGVFDAGAGSTGTNRCDASQPNAIARPTGVSDDCPAALSNPALITSDIATGDVAVVRYTNPEATVLDLGPRSVALQSWFGLKRVDATDHDVTLTDPTGYVVDTIPSGPGPGPFTGSVTDAWHPAPEAIGIAPDASDATGAPVSTPNNVPWTTVTLPGADRYFTDSMHYNEKGWPMCCLAVRQDNRRIPRWQSWDWHDYAYIYDGFGTDDTFCQLLINRNGIVFDSVPEVALPGPQDIDGPDAVWDDGTYYFAASWYVVLFGTPYLVAGPTLGGSGTTDETSGDTVPTVSFPSDGSGSTPTITGPTGSHVEGGQGGDIGQILTGLHVWEHS
jgi:hypothetical protein